MGWGLVGGDGDEGGKEGGEGGLYRWVGVFLGQKFCPVVGLPFY